MVLYSIVGHLYSMCKNAVIVMGNYNAINHNNTCFMINIGYWSTSSFYTVEEEQSVENNLHRDFE